MNADNTNKETMTSREIPISDDNQKNPSEAGDASTENIVEGKGASKSDHDAMVQVLEDRVRELEVENESLRDQRLRAIADLDNARRRAQQDVLNTVRYANEDMLKKILPIVDDFVRSVESGEENKDFESFYNGVVLIKNKLMKLLDEVEVKEIEALGEEFNVDLHEAMMRQPSDQPENTVVTVLEPGYTYKDKVIRHARVIVSAGDAN